MMGYDSSNLEIWKGYETPFRRSGHKLVMGDIAILLYDYCHEQISRLSQLLSTQFL